MTPWQTHVEKWKDCQLCPLGKQRGRIVLARGQIPCDILFVGEAPGQSEDVLGQPFVGPAGQLLDDIVRDALVLQPRQDFHLAFTNLVACFPREAKARGENEPQDSEVRACGERLWEFARIAKPRLIVAVGALANKFVAAIARTQFEAYCAIVHPAAILRGNPVQRDFMRQRAVVQLANAVEELK